MERIEAFDVNTVVSDRRLPRVTVLKTIQELLVLGEIDSGSRNFLLLCFCYI